MGAKADVKAAKASGKYPAEWFKGYTKMSPSDLVDVLILVAEHDAPDDVEEAPPPRRQPSRAEMAARGSRPSDVVAPVKAVKPEDVRDKEHGYGKPIRPIPEPVLTPPIHPVPAGFQTTPHGYPVCVAIRNSCVIEYKGMKNRRFIQGTIFRGENAWYMWDHHHDLVAPQ